MKLAIALLAIAGGTASADPCSPAELKLTAAKRLASWAKPEACIAAPSGNKIVASPAAFTAAFTCTGGVKSGLDFAKQRLVIAQWQMSPAAAGLDVYDDGKTITLVTHEMTPCPDDPHAMPINRNLYFATALLGDARTFATAQCTVTKKCK